MLQSSCNKENAVDNRVTKEVKKTGALGELLPAGVLPSNFTEDKASQFYEKHKGQSIDEIITILGPPLDKWENDGIVCMKYAVDGGYNTVNVGIDFSGFVLNFKGEKLFLLENRYGAIYK